MVKNVNPCSHLSSCPALAKKALELERPTQNDGFKWDALLSDQIRHDRRRLLTMLRTKDVRQ